MSLYLDASVILPTLVDEATSESVEHFFRSRDDAIIISEFGAAEVASALSRLTRTGLLKPEPAAACLRRFDAWRAMIATDLELAPSDLKAASVIVRQFELGLRAPDALHLALCRRADLTLVTLDGRMAAAGGPLGVKVITP